jgi:subtilase-type serine protease
MFVNHMMKTGLTLTAVTLLAGCGGGSGGSVDTGTSTSTSSSSVGSVTTAGFTALSFLVETVSGGTFSADALSASLVTSFDAYEDHARTLRDSALYKAQEVDWYVDSNGNGRRDPSETLYQSYSLASARVEYAHAVGLTGAGEVIAVVDGDFRPSHEAIAGRVDTYTAPRDPGSIASSDISHGTAVASVLAGLSSSMIGVAHESRLLLGSYSTMQDLAEATTLARTKGAIVQNNSWGFVNSPATSATFSSALQSGEGRPYLTALREFTRNGVVVFAAQNARDVTSAGIMEALPMFAPELEAGWLAVITGVPEFDNTRILSVQRTSAPCLQAARWCLVADGTWNAATAMNDQDYALYIGTSFAAPVVSGAIALLAQAFPNLTAHDLRARLIATADNRFAGFTADGRLEVVPGSGFFHDYSTEWGHGFLDLRAALLPIGTPAARMADGTVHSVSEPLIVTGGATGDAVARSLAAVPVLVTDLLGGDFTMPAETMSAQAKATPVSQYLWSAMSGTLAQSGLMRAYGAPEMTLQQGQIRLALLGTDAGNGHAAPGGAEPPLAAAIGQTLAAAGGELFIGVNVARDDGSLMPAIGGRASTLAALDLTFSRQGDHGGFLEFGGTLGLSPGGSGAVLSDRSDILFNAFRVEAGQTNLLRQGDRLSLGVALPVAVTSGRAQIALPVSRSASGIQHSTVGIDYSPANREVDLSITYGTPFGAGGEMFLGAVHAINHGHIAGAQDTAAILGLRMAF